MTATTEPTQRTLLVVAAAALLASGIGLSASRHFPQALLDDQPLTNDHTAVATGSLVLLLVAGIALTLAARATRTAQLIGTAAGVSTVATALLGLLLMPSWSAPLAKTAFVASAVVAPSLLAIWTASVIRETGTSRVLGVLGVIGLVATLARSSVWMINAALPRDEGIYVISAVLTLIALLGAPLWLCWLVRTGRRPLRGIARVGAMLATVIFAFGYAVTMLNATPTPRTDEVPDVPSAGGAVRYLAMLALADQFALPVDIADLHKQRGADEFTKPEYPDGTDVRRVDAGGVPSEFLCARGASQDRVGLYTPGGGFLLPPSNSARRFAAAVSRESGMCVLMPTYRLAPEHPFPAAIQDCAAAYRWLRKQGIPARRIAIFGDSAGGNLTLTTTLWLRDAGDDLPAALVPVSGITDFTLSGKTVRSKNHGDPLITRRTREFTVSSFSGNTDRRDPRLSPLYADLSGLPPTLVTSGSQEVLLSDSIRIADRLRAAGVPTTLEIWPGMPHSWQSARKQTLETKLAVRHLARFIRLHTT